MKRQSSSQMLFAVILIAIGAVLLLGNLEIANVSSFWRWLPMIVVAIGVWQLVTNNFKNVTGPIILIAVAGAFQLAALDLIGWDLIAKGLWPTLIIVAGVSLIFKRSRVGEDGEYLGDSSDMTRAFAIFSGAKRVVTSLDFVGGEATALFGGVDIDLRNAQIERRPATLSATALFGGIDIKVPEDWVVHVDVMALFGGASDDRKLPPAGERGAPPDLVVTGVALFGGVGVKDH